MTATPTRIQAPFSLEQVNNLNAYQAVGQGHPFTCGGEGCREILIAGRPGWTCLKCSYEQKWAWEWMANANTWHSNAIRPQSRPAKSRHWPLYAYLGFQIFLLVLFLTLFAAGQDVSGGTILASCVTTAFFCGWCIFLRKP